MIENASPLEWAWTLIALVGVLLGAVTVVYTIGDAVNVWYPPRGLLTRRQERALGAERTIGLWIAVKWIGLTICHGCNLIIGWRAMLNPAPPPTEPIRAEGAIITGLCLIAVEVILVALTFGQLYTRWIVLRLHADQHAAARRPPVRPQTHVGGNDATTD